MLSIETHLPATISSLMEEPSSPPRDTGNKRKPPTTSTSTSDSRPPKRQHPDSTSSSDEISDTATSKRENKEEEDEVEKEELVELPDDVVYQELDEYEFINGKNPVEDHDEMLKYVLPYIHVGIGNASGWRTKFRRLKNKFKNQISGPSDPDQEEEFLLWKKMFGRVPPPDSGSRIS